MATPRLSYPVFRQPGRVTVGTCCVRELSRLCPDDAVVFMSAQPSVGRVVAESMAMQGAELGDWPVCLKPPGEPTRPMLEQGAAFLAANPRRTIVGVGGGSVLDWCRLSWALAVGALDDARGLPPEYDAPAFVLIPTTCASGAEAAMSAVYSNGQRMVAVTSTAFLASEVYLDSQFVSSMSERGIACAIGDSASHAVEAYCSLASNGLGRHFAVTALRLVLEYGSAMPSAWRQERLLEAAYLGGVAASNCSVGVVHAFAYTLGMFGFPHGLANALGLRAGLMINAAAPAVRDLAWRAGVGTVSSLSAQLADILSTACEPEDAERLAALLNDPAQRAVLRERMLAEPSLQTNPVRLDEAAIERFLRDVAQTWDVGVVARN
jgi:alcohol dehydrogenase class IV